MLIVLACFSGLSRLSEQIEKSVEGMFFSSCLFVLFRLVVAP